MATSNPRHYRYVDLISDIENGQIKIPQFQRDFVWDLKASANLIDSVLKNYPIGTFILWRTDDRLRTIKNIGSLDLPDPKDGEFVNFVLDGQQRLTSLFASLKGLSIKREGKYETDYSHIYIDLMVSENEQVVITDVSSKEEKSYISMQDLIKGDFELLASFPSPQKEKIKKYIQVLESYSFSYIEVKDAEIDVATDIFTRLNVGGKSLTLFEIMVAKTYDSEKNFDLAEEYDKFKEELQDSKFDTIPAATILQTLSILLKRDCTRKEILKISKSEFIEMWEPALDSIRSAIDYIRTYYRIPVSRLLPYYALIVPFSYYFHKQKTKPTGETQKRLEDFFWRASIGGRYSSGVESKLASDIEKIDNIIRGKVIKYDWSINTTPEFIQENGWFSTGRSYIKAILSIMAAQGPLSFDDNAIVTIDNSWLKIASSKNYHHFFPKAYLKKTRKDLEEYYINHIANITIVDDYLNKNKIRAKAPSKYISTFQKDNPDIEKSLRTHLISSISDFGIPEDDYDTFFEKRLKMISKQLEKRIILTDADNHIESIDEDDSNSEVA
jgi:hypothetical protein